MKSYKVIILCAEAGYRLHNKADNAICSAIQLPIDSDVTDWEEITEDEAKAYEVLPDVIPADMTVEVPDVQTSEDVKE